ncbi:MAG TPA: response regulator transcription factor [Actinomycetota bacterium]
MPGSGPDGRPRAGGRILVVDDEEHILRAVGRALDARGYQVATAVDGEGALRSFHSVEPDLIVLDLNLPGMDGLEVCRRVRARSNVPILVLSAREDEVDKVAALDLGADDYLTKPFGIDELLARVRALLRRSSGQSMAGRFEADGVRIDLERREVTRNGDRVHLTRTEWALLDAFAEHPGKLLTQRWLLDRVWGSGYDEDVDVLRVFVSQLRKKIEPDPRRPRIVVTDPGVGYRWALRPAAPA